MGHRVINPTLNGARFGARHLTDKAWSVNRRGAPTPIGVLCFSIHEDGVGPEIAPIHNHVVVFGERHLRYVLLLLMNYYNDA